MSWLQACTHQMSGALLENARAPTAAGLSALALVAQALIQAAFLLGAPGVGAAAPFLRLVGFPPGQGIGGALLATVPLLLALMASAAQVQAARHTTSEQQRRQAEGMELQPLRPMWRSPRRSSGAAVSAWVAAAALLASALAHPSVLASPYMLAAAAAVWHWSGGGGSGGGRGGSSAVASLLQPYTAAFLLALYLWQAGLGGWPWLQPVADMLGLFTISDAGVSAAVQLAALLLLFLAIGTAGGGSSLQLSIGAAPSSWGAGTEAAPLLLHDRQQAQASDAPPRSPRPPPPLTMQSLLQLLLLDTAEVVCREPAAVAAVLCGGAMVRPSVLGGLVLAWGLLALLAHPVAAALRRWARPMTAALLVSVHGYEASRLLFLQLVQLADANLCSLPLPFRRSGSSPAMQPRLRLQLPPSQQRRRQLGCSPRAPPGRS